MKPLEQEAQEIFEAHPKLNVVYITSDGIGYESEHNANQHAKTLEDRSVAKFERFVQEPSSKDENPSDKDKNPSDKGQGTGDNGGQTKDEGNDELNEGDVNKEPSDKGKNPSDKDENPSNKEKNKKK